MHGRALRSMYYKYNNTSVDSSTNTSIVKIFTGNTDIQYYCIYVERICDGRSSVKYIKSE